MRESVHPVRGQAGRRLNSMLRLVETALTCATAALFDSHSDAVASMTAADRALHELRDEIEDQASALLGDSSATPDIRTVVTGVHVGRDVERMTELTRQIAEIAWSRLREPPPPAHPWSLVEDIGRTALTLVDEAARASESAGAGALGQSEAGLREIGQQQQLLDRLLYEHGADDIRAAVDATLLGHCYEGCARHASAAARRLVLLVDMPA